MKIYTGFGDSGKTQLYGGQVVDKDDLRVDTYGTADELNSHLGFVGAQLKDEQLITFLQNIQQAIFRISAELATPVQHGSTVRNISINQDDIKIVESKIDDLESILKPLKHFILPGGSNDAASIHITRTVCRRFERRLVAFAKIEELDQNIIIFINRLSDFLFVLARYMNKNAGKEDIAWTTKFG